jgi:hypothetical protein
MPMHPTGSHPFGLLTRTAGGSDHRVWLPCQAAASAVVRGQAGPERMVTPHRPVTLNARNPEPEAPAGGIPTSPALAAPAPLLNRILHRYRRAGVKRAISRFALYDECVHHA